MRKNYPLYSLHCVVRTIMEGAFEDSSVLNQSHEVIEAARVEEPNGSQVDVKSGISEFHEAERDLKGIIDSV